MSRHLNGILATLETCDWALSKVFFDLSYHNYKNNEWISMLKNKLRIRILNDTPNVKLDQLILSNQDDILKKMQIFDRNQFLLTLAQTGIPINIDNIVFLANIVFVHNQNIKAITLDIIIKKYEKIT